MQSEGRNILQLEMDLPGKKIQGGFGGSISQALYRLHGSNTANARGDDTEYGFFVLASSLLHQWVARLE